MRLSIAALAILLSGCGLLGQSPTEADPATPAQARAIEYCHKFADILHVELKAVVFVDDTRVVEYDGKPQYDANGVVLTACCWAVVNNHTIVWWKPYVERDYVWDLIPAYAAHEVCHLYYKDRADSASIEQRADACARDLLK